MEFVSSFLKKNWSVPCYPRGECWNLPWVEEEYLKGHACIHIHMYCYCSTFGNLFYLCKSLFPHLKNDWCLHYKCIVQLIRNVKQLSWDHVHGFLKNIIIMKINSAKHLWAVVLGDVRDKAPETIFFFILGKYWKGVGQWKIVTTIFSHIFKFIFMSFKRAPVKNELSF